MQTRPKRQRLALFSILLLTVFSYPFVSIANHTKLTAGFPMLLLYLFVAWIVAIVILFLLSEKTS